MRTDLMYQPMGVLALITFVALSLIPLRRFQAAARGTVTSADFRFGESAAVPGAVSIPNRNYMNLTEVPVLFYVVALMFVTADRVTGVALGLAWIYVALRALHSLVHLTYNNVFHRLTLFAASNFVLAGLWVAFFVGQAGASVTS